jgi:hypothetical protein
MRAAGLAVAVFLVAFARSLAEGIGLTDESWFLQVASRLRAGDVLYRDVFLGATPLSMYVTTALTFVTGVEIVAVKIVTNACFAATTVLTGRIVRQVGLSPQASWIVMGALIVWGRPYASPPYTPMAMTFFVAAFAAAIGAAERRDGSDRRSWFVAGALAGLGLMSKQNVGLLALGAVAAAALIGRPGRGGWTAVAIAVAGALAVSALVLAPVALSGGLPGLWEYGFAAKGAYVRVGGVSMLDSARVWLDGLGRATTTDGLAAAVHGAVIALPALVLVAAGLSARQLDRRGWVLALFTCAAVATAFPRWDRFHMAYALPVHFVTLAYLLSRWPTVVNRPAMRQLTAAAVLVAGLLVIGQPVVRTRLEGRRVSALPHFRGPLLPPGEAARLAAAAGRLRLAADGQPTFVLDLDAGFWYLASGLSNPTPFDMPARTSVGSTGVSWLLAQLMNGDISRVCIDNGPLDRLALDEVAGWVRGHFGPGTDVGPCTVFERTRAGRGPEEK